MTGSRDHLLERISQLGHSEGDPPFGHITDSREVFCREGSHVEHRPTRRYRSLFALDGNRHCAGFYRLQDVAHQAGW